MGHRASHILEGFPLLNLSHYQKGAQYLKCFSTQGKSPGKITFLFYHYSNDAKQINKAIYMCNRVIYTAVSDPTNYSTFYRLLAQFEKETRKQTCDSRPTLQTLSDV